MNIAYWGEQRTSSRCGRLDQACAYGVALVALRKVIVIVGKDKDTNDQKQILSGMMAFCDKEIGFEDAEEIRRIIKMTKFEQILYKEKMEAVNRAVDENAENIAENLLKDGAEIEFVSRNTGLDLAVVKAIAQRIVNEQTANALMG